VNGEPSWPRPGRNGVRFAIIAALVVHAALIVWLAPHEHEHECAPARMPLAAPPAPADTVVDVVLFEDATPVAATSNAKLPVARAKAAAGAPRQSIIAKAAAAPAVGEASPAVAGPGSLPPARDYFGMRQPDLSPAQLVDHAPARERAAPPAVSDGELRPSGRGTYTTDLGGSDWRNRTATAHVARDGTVKFENAPDFDIHFSGLGFAGKFNVDDWLARKFGMDPYSSAKLAFLDRTRDERARIAEVSRAEDLSHAQLAMRRNVDAARMVVDLAARKQALFELWDDVAETGDEPLVRAGADARAYLVGAIRAMRPTLTFTPDEIAQLNAHRHSRAVFSPYE
jgi:hypothetical protein